MHHPLPLLILFAFILSWVPIISWPFSWLTIFFHEVSHGLVSIATGGSLEKIEIYLHGTGLCYTKGGIRWLVYLAGYLGATLCGAMIYLSANKSKRIWHVYTALILLATCLWAKDLITITILLILAITLLTISSFEKHMLQYAIKFLGIYILLDAIKAPLYLLDGEHIGDGAELAALTGVPEVVWVVMWFTASTAILLLLVSRREVKS